MGLAGLVKIAARVRPAAGMHKAIGSGHGVVRFVPVGEQNPLEAFDEAHRHRPATRGVVIKENDPAAKGTTCPHPDPVIRAGRLVALEYLQARLIAVDKWRAEHLLVHEVNQRHDVRCAQLDHPAGHGRASERDA